MSSLEEIYGFLSLNQNNNENLFTFERSQSVFLKQLRSALQIVRSLFNLLPFSSNMTLNRKTTAH